MNELKKRIENADVLNLGSTYAFFDFNYSDTKKKGVNLAGKPQYLDVDFCLLKKYKNYIKKHSKVLIVLPDFVFAVDSVKESQEQLQTYNKLGYTGYDNPVFRVYLKSRYNTIKRKIFSSQKSYIPSNLDNNQKEQAAKDRIESWIRDVGILSVESHDVPNVLKRNIENNLQILNSMIDFCKGNEWEAIIVIPPVSQCMNNKVTKECLNAYLYSPIANRKDQTVKVLDYMNDVRFQDLKLYWNADCLNSKGAKMFTDIVLKDIYGS